MAVGPDSTAKVGDLAVNEKFFIMHDKKLQKCLVELKKEVQQTEAEQADFLNIILNKTQAGREVEASDVKQAVHTSIGDDPALNEAVLVFSGKALKVAGKVPLKSKPEVGVVGDHDPLNLGNSQEVLKIQGLEYNSTPFKEHPELETAVSAFVKNSNLGSGNVLDLLELLEQYAKVNETLTFLCSNPMLSRALGANLFIICYFSLGVEGSYSYFLNSVRSKVEWRLRPFERGFKSTLKFVWDNKYRFLSGATLSGGFYVLTTKKTVVPRVPLVVDLPITALPESLSPQPGYFSDMIHGFKGKLRTYVNDLVSSSLEGAKNAFLEALFGSKDRLLGDKKP